MSLIGKCWSGTLAAILRSFAARAPLPQGGRHRAAGRRAERPAMIAIHGLAAGRWRLARALLACLCAVFVGACATKSEPATLVLGMEDAPGGKRLMWPVEAEIPRYLFAGQLVGEANFRKPEQRDEGVGGFFRWLAGVIAGDAAPVVLQRPQSGTVDAAGRIYVTDVSRQAVFVFDPQDGELKVWDRALEGRNFVAPVGIAVEPSGQVLVADAELGIVARLDRNGNPVGAIGQGTLSRPTGLAFDSARQQLYVADTYAHDIKVFDADGRLLRAIGRRGDGGGEFNFPTYLALRQGELYVTDTMNARVQVLSAEDGRFLREIGKRGLYVGNLVRPKGVALDGEGNVYVVESYFDHLLVYDRKGEFLMPIGGVGAEVGKFYLPAGVWVDARNRVFVADMFNGRVVVFHFLGGSNGE